MDAMAQAALWFWLPVALIPLGIWIFLSSKESLQRRMGQAMALLGLTGVVLSPWTVPESPSIAAGHLVGFLIGPAALLLAGLYLVAFSGNVAVGKLPKSDRRLGVMAFLIGFVWFTGMHWWNLTPSLDGEVNRYWLVFWPTFLLLMVLLSMQPRSVITCGLPVQICWGLLLGLPSRSWCLEASSCSMNAL